jgi:hypothetical protein
MAETLNFREAVQRAGVSRQRLNEAIRSGRLPAQRGGGPGRPTTIQLEDLQAWCVSEGLAMPVEAGERLERLAPSAMMERLQRLDDLFAGMQRLEHLMEQVLERLEGSTMSALSSTAEDKKPTSPTSLGQRTAVLQQLHAMQAEGLSLQAMANRFNSEGVPTLSGKGRWQKGTIGNLLAQIEE